MTQQSFPGIDTVDHGHHVPQRFLSVPDIHVSSEPQKSTKSRTGSKTKLRVSVLITRMYLVLPVSNLDSRPMFAVSL